MDFIDLSAAQKNLFELLDRVEAGEEFVIERAGRPVARLVPYKRESISRSPGAWRGRVWIADDFDELDEEIVKAFQR